MTEFSVKTEEVSYRRLSVSIQHPGMPEGAGWTYDLTVNDWFFHIGMGCGDIRIEHTDHLIALLKHTADIDAKRPVDSYQILPYGSVFYDEEEEFYEDAARFALPIAGPEEHNLFIVSSAFIDTDRNSLTTLTVQRIVDKYYVFVGGVLALTFSSWELEAITALLEHAVEEFC
jgi:hypothetical protein